MIKGRNLQLYFNFRLIMIKGRNLQLYFNNDEGKGLTTVLSLPVNND